MGNLTCSSNTIYSAMAKSGLVLEVLVSLPRRRDLEVDSPRTYNIIVDCVSTSENHQLFVSYLLREFTDTTRVAYSSGQVSHNDNEKGTDVGRISTTACPEASRTMAEVFLPIESCND